MKKDFWDMVILGVIISGPAPWFFNRCVKRFTNRLLYVGWDADIFFWDVTFFNY
jgi:hypothetical protein